MSQLHGLDRKCSQEALCFDLPSATDDEIQPPLTIQGQPKRVSRQEGHFGHDATGR